jgi:hypothetical protein
MPKSPINTPMRFDSRAGTHSTPNDHSRATRAAQGMGRGHVVRRHDYDQPLGHRVTETTDRPRLRQPRSVHQHQLFVGRWDRYVLRDGEAARGQARLRQQDSRDPLHGTFPAKIRQRRTADAEHPRHSGAPSSQRDRTTRGVRSPGPRQHRIHLPHPLEPSFRLSTRNQLPAPSPPSNRARPWPWSRWR